MHGFDAVWWSSCSRFKHCAMVPDSSCRQLARLLRKNSDRASEFFILSQLDVGYFFGSFAFSYGLGECGQVKLAVIE